MPKRTSAIPDSYISIYNGPGNIPWHVQYFFPSINGRQNAFFASLDNPFKFTRWLGGVGPSRPFKPIISLFCLTFNIMNNSLH